MELVAAPTSLEVAPQTVASEEQFALIVPAGINARTKWLVATAVLGLVGAAALGLTLMRALSVSSAASAKVSARARRPFRGASARNSCDRCAFYSATRAGRGTDGTRVQRSAG